jgi:phytanoyl-CoA hydroxylase
MEKPGLEFDRETVPWLDKYYVEIQAYVADLPLDQRPAYDLSEQLIHWLRHGYATFPGLIEHGLIDAYLADIERLISDRSTSGVSLQIHGYGEGPARGFPPEAFGETHLRIMDLHNASTAGKALALHPRIVEFLTHLFRAAPVAMQTLTFIYGSEQGSHQDFAYVVAEVPSHLAATWIALEDVDPDAGPLFYFPGSHTVEKFDWGDGILLTTESTRTVPEFMAHLEDQVAKRSYRVETFCPRKGDVFFWHSALVHGGSARRNPALTRRSVVTHYSTATAYTRDRRAPHQVPTVYELNGGLVFANPTNPADEDRYSFWPLPGDTRVHVRDLRSSSD